MQLQEQAAGKRSRGHPNPASWGCTLTLVSARTTQHIPAYITGKINQHPTQLLLDSGASCSVISKKHIKIDELSPENSMQLINTDGRSFMPLGTSSATVTLREFSASHSFLIVKKLSVPVIMGCDFMSKHGLVLDIQGGMAYQSGTQHRIHLDTQVATLCTPLIVDDELPQALPSKITIHSVPDLPKTSHPAISDLIDEYKVLFFQQIGQTNIVHHIIDTEFAS